MAHQGAAERETKTQFDRFNAAEADLRIVLVGKTGAGKSAAGNTILRRKAFPSSLNSSSVTAECKKELGEFEGQTLAVVDTPGLFDTDKCQEHIKREVSKCIYFAAPGPHVFLIVIQPNRFTKEEQETVDLIKEMFGKLASGHTMALFTHGDDLKEEDINIEKFIDGSEALRKFTRQCGGGYHVFDNREKDVSQVRELLKKVNKVVRRNGGRCYTNEMLKQAQSVKNEIAAKILEKNKNLAIEEAKRWAEEAIARQLAENEARQQVTLTSDVDILTVPGAVIGGVLGGPAGAMVGAAAGRVVDMVTKSLCTIQ